MSKQIALDLLRELEELGVVVQVENDAALDEALEEICNED